MTNLNDAGEGSLRWAIQQAKDQATRGHAIYFEEGLTGTISLQTQLPFLLNDTDIVGNTGITVQRSTAAGTPRFSIFTLTTGDTSAISNLTIRNGSTVADGGGIWNAGTLSLVTVKVRNNTADGYGGGIYNKGTLTVADSEIDNNNAGLEGGGLYNSGPVWICCGSKIHHNTARQGGGIYNKQEQEGAATVMIEDDSEITFNVASNGSGGGIYNWGGSVSMTGGKIEDNSATNRGGGLFERAAGEQNSSSYTNVSIRRNNANAKGGGFALWGPGGITFTFCTISNNTAPVAAGGIVKSDAWYMATSCTITDDIIADDPIG